MTDDRSAMRILRTILRFSGLLLGAFLLLGGAADAAGLLPAQEPAATLAQRLRADLPLMLAGALLLLPYARLGRRLQAVCLAGLALVSLVLVGLAAKAVEGFLAGHLHWAAIPASLAILAVIAGNAWVLGHLRRRPRALG